MNEEQEQTGGDVIFQVADIVSAFVSHNSTRAADLPELIGAVHASLKQLSNPPTPAEAKPPEAPAVPVKRSISKDFIVCLEDGKKFKSLRRHLSSFHKLTPEEYRAKWGLPSDYPMVAPAYSATRSQLAKESGLGQVVRAEGAPTADGTPTSESAPASEGSAAPDGEAPPAKKPRGRPRKSA